MLTFHVIFGGLNLSYANYFAEAKLEIVASVILGIVLGITEFLPISSLGHSLVLSNLLSNSAQFLKDKNNRDFIAIFIQGGAVLAVLVYYARDLIKEARQLPSDPKTRRLWLNVLIAFLPVGILGLLFNNFITTYLFSPLIVGIALVVGGVIFLLVEQKSYQPTTHKLEDITPRQALSVGIAQITALIPGVSRSGATIIGGLLTGLDRTVATVFTFYLFIPTLGAAVGYELYKAFKGHTITGGVLPYFLLAAAVGFVVSLIAIRWLLRFISNHNFKGFGIYRIIIGLIIIALALFTTVLS